MNLVPCPPPPPPMIQLRRSEQDSLEDDYENPESSIISTLIRRFESYDESYAAVWKPAPSILQNGPQCGLVALCIAAECLNVSVDIKSVFEKGLELKVTKQGEMFSTASLARLAESFNIKTSYIYSGMSNSNYILQQLSCGRVLLVPYDADRNHSPCLQKGHKAHWALVFGFAIPSRFCSPSTAPEQLSGRLSRLPHAPDSTPTNVEKEHILLLAKQGKSKHTAVWKYSDLEQSNANLAEVDPKRNNNAEYILPHDNSLADLCCKLLIVG